jgi:hypothetical protein
VPLPFLRDQEVAGSNPVSPTTVDSHLHKDVPEPGLAPPAALRIAHPSTVAHRRVAVQFHAGSFTDRAAGRQAEALVGHRTASPWDEGSRRPSHADKRRAWRRELLAEEIRAVLRPGVTEREMMAAAERLLNLTA